MGLDSTLTLPVAAGVHHGSAADRTRLRKAFDKNYVPIWRFLRRMGLAPDRADDAAQQIFLIAFEAMARIQSGSERSFLYGTAVRLVHGIRRRSKREVATDGLEWLSSAMPPPDQLADQKKARDVLDAIIDSLDPDARTVFVLAEFDGFTTPEIARLLDVPLGTAASRLRRARDKFQTLVRGVYGDEP
ncbi:MAG: RNA polymerase sigma factor [Polyangiaceae bacterium]|jgi:RNA polymerase sigma-70 factor (ECF subfamily)